MKKEVILFSAILGLILLIIVLIQRKPKKDPPVKLTGIAGLIAAIKQDTVYQVLDVFYDSLDSMLEIKVVDSPSFPMYFYTTYNINKIDSVYKIVMTDSHGHSTAFTNKTKIWVLNEFQRKYINDDICYPLEEAIQRSLLKPNSYHSDFIDLEYLSDSNVLITNLYHLKQDTSKMYRVMAKIDINGKIIFIKPYPL